MGFKPPHSTGAALVKVVNNLLLVSDHSHGYFLALNDFSEAINSTDKNILIEWKMLSTLREYLYPGSGLTLMANVNGNISVHKKMKFAFPQGSGLGQLPFPLYTELALGINFHRND